MLFSRLQCFAIVSMERWVIFLQRDKDRTSNLWQFLQNIAWQYISEDEDWKFGLMIRDITTTYNTWTIDEVKYQEIADAVPGENQELPETSEITLPKAQFGISKKS